MPDWKWLLDDQQQEQKSGDWQWLLEPGDEGEKPGLFGTGEQWGEALMSPLTSLGVGARNLNRTMYNLYEWGYDVTGNEEMRQEMIKNAEYEESKIAEESARLREQRGTPLESGEVSNIPTGLQYAGHMIGSNLPTMIPGMAIGTAAMAAAPATATGLTLAGIGAAAGAVGAMPMSMGEVRQSQREKESDPNALATVAAAIPYAGLEGIQNIIPGARAVPRFLRPGAAGRTLPKAVGTIITKTLEDIGIAASSGGAVEALQTAEERYLSGKELFSPEAFSEYKEAAIAGAAMEAGMAGPAGALSATSEQLFGTGAANNPAKLAKDKEEAVKAANIEKARQRMSIMLDGSQLSTDELLTGEIEYGAGKDQIFNRDIYLAQLNRAIRSEPDATRKKALQELRKKVKKEQDALRESEEFAVERAALEEPSEAEKAPKEETSATMLIKTASDRIENQARTQNALVDVTKRLAMLRDEFSALEMVDLMGPKGATLTQEITKAEFEKTILERTVMANDADAHSRALQANAIYDNVIATGGTAAEARDAASKELETLALKHPATQLTRKEVLVRQLAEFSRRAEPLPGTGVDTTSRLWALQTAISTILSNTDAVFGSPDLSDPLSQNALAQLRKMGLNVVFIEQLPNTADVSFAKGLAALLGKTVAIMEYDANTISMPAAGTYAASSPDTVFVYRKFKDAAEAKNYPLSVVVSHELMHSVLMSMPMRMRDALLKVGGAFDQVRNPFTIGPPVVESWVQWATGFHAAQATEYMSLIAQAQVVLANGMSPEAYLSLISKAEVIKQQLLDEYLPYVFEHNMTNRQMWQAMVDSNKAFSLVVSKRLFSILDALDKTVSAYHEDIQKGGRPSQVGNYDFISKVIKDRVDVGQFVSMLADILQQRFTLSNGETLNVGSATPTAARPPGSNEYAADVEQTSVDRLDSRDPAPMSSDMAAARLEDNGRALIAAAHNDFKNLLNWVIERERMGQVVTKDELLDELIPILNRMGSGFDHGHTAFGLSIGPYERALYEEASRLGGSGESAVSEGAGTMGFPNTMQAPPGMQSPSVAIPSGHGIQFAPQQRLQRMVQALWECTSTNPVKAGPMVGVFENWATTAYAFDKAFPTYDLSDPTSQGNIKKLDAAGIRLLKENDILRGGRSKGQPLAKDPAYSILRDFCASLGKQLYVVEIDAQKANVDALGSFSRSDPEAVWVFKPHNTQKSGKASGYEDLNVAAVGFHEIMHSVFDLLPDNVQAHALKELGAVTEKRTEMRSGVERSVTGLELLMQDLAPRLTAKQLRHELGIDMDLSTLKARGTKMSSVLSGLLMNLETHASKIFGSDLFGPNSVVATHMQFPEVAEAATIDPTTLASLTENVLNSGIISTLLRSEYFSVVMEKMFTSDPKMFIEAVMDFSPDAVKQVLLPMYEKMEALEAAGIDLKDMGVESGSKEQLTQEKKLAFDFTSLNRGIGVLAEALCTIVEGEPSITPIDFGFPEDAFVGRGESKTTSLQSPPRTGPTLPSGMPIPLADTTAEGRAEAAERRKRELLKKWKKSVDGIRDSGVDRQQVDSPRPNRGSYKEAPNDFLKAKGDRLKVLGNVFYINKDGDVTINWGTKDKDGKVQYKPIKIDPQKLMKKIRAATLQSKDAAAALSTIKKYYGVAEKLNMVDQIDEIRTEVAVKWAKELLDATYPLKPITFFGSYLKSMEDQLEKQAGPLGKELVQSGKLFRARVARRLSQFLSVTGREKPGSKEWKDRIDVRLSKFNEEERENFWDWVAQAPGSAISFPSSWSADKRKDAADLVTDMRDAKDWAYREAGRVWGPAIAKALEEHAPKYYKHDILIQLLRGKVDKNPSWMKVINQIKVDQQKLGRTLTDEEAQKILDRAVGAMITWNREGLGAMIGKGPEAGSLTHGRRLDLPFGYEKDPLIWFFRYVDEAARFIAWGETMRVPASRFAANLEKLTIDDPHRKTVQQYFKDYLKVLSNRSIRNEGEDIFSSLKGESRWEQVLKFWIDLRLLSPNSWGANLSQLWEIVNVVGFNDSVRAIVDLLAKRAPVSTEDGAALDSVHAGLVEFSKLAKSGQRVGAGSKELMWNALQPFQMVEYWINRAVTPKISQALLWHYADGAFKAFMEPQSASPKDFRSLVMLRNFIYDMDGLFKLWEEAGHVVLTDDIMAEGGFKGTQGTQLAQTPEAAPRGSRKAMAVQLAYVFKTFQIKRLWNVIHRVTDGAKINAERYAQIEEEKMKAAPDLKRITQLEKEIGAERSARNTYVLRLAATSPVIGSAMQAAMFGMMGRYDESVWYEMYRKYEQGNLGLTWHDFQDYIRMYLQSIMYISMVGVVLDIADRVLFGQQGGLVDSVSRYMLGPVYGYILNFSKNMVETAKGVSGDPSGRTLKEGAIELAGDVVGGASRYGKPGAGNPTWRERYGDVDVFMNIQRKRFNQAIQRGDFELATTIRENIMERYPEWAVRNRSRRIEKRTDFLDHGLYPTR